jgi:hypothetical protein
MIVRKDILYVAMRKKASVEKFNIKTGAYLGQLLKLSSSSSKIESIAWNPVNDYMVVVDNGRNVTLEYNSNTGLLSRTLISNLDYPCKSRAAENDKNI